jgi:hypothetical protein
VPTGAVDEPRVRTTSLTEEHADRDGEQQPADRVARLAPGNNQAGRRNGHVGNAGPASDATLCRASSESGVRVITGAAMLAASSWALAIFANVFEGSIPAPLALMVFLMMIGSSATVVVASILTVVLTVESRHQ